MQPTAEPTLHADLSQLIAEIEAATAGSVALDARIHFGFRIAAQSSPDVAALLIAEGITWPTVEALLDDGIPPYTTSLDAALAGEKVVFVIRSARRRRWGAMQKARCGEEVMVWAATEPLVRRLAAIRAFQLDLEKSDIAPVEAPFAEHATEAANDSQPADMPAGADEWEVTF